MQPNDAHADESDSGDDSDYVPPAHDSDAGREAKRVRMNSPGVVSDAPEDKEAKKGHRDALWASFQSSVATPHLSVPQPSLEKTIKIEKRYNFAGEDVIEVKEVPEGSDEAKKWPRWHAPSVDPPESGPSKPGEPATTQATSVPKPAKKPGPRRPKTLLTPLPGTHKAKKLTTLDKSAMDWRTHVGQAQQSSGLKDELDANRRGGGYLEKVEFLQRVEQRKDEAFEANKSNKRRRG